MNIFFTLPPMVKYSVAPAIGDGSRSACVVGGDTVMEPWTFLQV